MYIQVQRCVSGTAQRDQSNAKNIPSSAIGPLICKYNLVKRIANVPNRHIKKSSLCAAITINSQLS